MSRPVLLAVTEGAGARPGPDAGIDALARAIWAHGRERGIRAMEALAAMAVNRRTLFPGRTLACIASDPTLFAAWDPADARHEAMRRADSADPAFAAALRVARRALAGGADPVDGATWFHDIADPVPAGVAALAPRALLAGFHFYRT
ncbi:cell wall hydrolase [Niveispirillum fermenti]|uniref:cell wall hydrolase n=1 Tax=Niveispirillum fermenti TaxID=1233113 RepID=UPI003A8B94C2